MNWNIVHLQDLYKLSRERGVRAHSIVQIHLDLHQMTIGLSVMIVTFVMQTMVIMGANAARRIAMGTFVMAHSTIAPRQFVSLAILMGSYPMVPSDGALVRFALCRFTRITRMVNATFVGLSIVRPLLVLAFVIANAQDIDCLTDCLISAMKARSRRYVVWSSL